jgi:hypothetical protein
LPSLEWLERVNTRSLGAAAILVVVGFFTGVIARLATAGGAGVPWTDPVVLSLSGMMSWLVAAEAFRVAYPAARRGRKVAYLTLAAAAFLAFTLASFMRVDGVHRGRSEERVERSGGEISDFGSWILDCRRICPLGQSKIQDLKSKVELAQSYPYPRPAAHRRPT